MKKVICIFLTVSMLAVIFACSKGEDNVKNADNNDNAVSDNNTADGVNPDNPAILDKQSKWIREPVDLPETDFNGRTFSVITVEVTSPNKFYDYFSTGEQTGDPVIDALYIRKLHVEEKYNVTINSTPSATPAATAKKSIMAGDMQYDLIVDTILNIRDLASQQSLADLYSVPYIKDDLGKPWWDHALIRDLSINGKLYFGSGDIVLRDKLRTSCIYFNKEMFGSAGLEYPYKYVYEGKWTIDKLMELTKGANADLDGNGVMDQYDKWGFMSEYDFVFQLFAAAGEKTVGLNKEKVPEITINTPRALDVIQKALEYCTDATAMFHADTIKGVADIWLTASEYFQENRFLMRASVFEPIPRDLRAMPTDFGILPTAKFNEQQENYYASVDRWALVVGIPYNADLDFVGFITDATAYESGSTLMPAFYDLCLTSKVLRDDESEGMLDIIFNNKVYDIGYIYGIGSTQTILAELAQAKSTDFVSKYEKAQGSIEKALQKLIDSYET